MTGIPGQEPPLSLSADCGSRVSLQACAGDEPHRYDHCVISYADPAALIDDPRVLRVAISDNGEPLVDVRSITALDVDQARAQVQQLSDNPFCVRAEVAQRLARAQACLPDGYQIQVKEGWRPIWVQQRLWDQCLDRLQESHPHLGPEEARRENARFVAPPGTAPPAQHRRRSRCRPAP